MNEYSRWILWGGVTAALGLWPVAGTWAADDRDACAMLHKVDVEAAFAPRAFDAGTPGFALKGSKSMAAVSNCTYNSRGATTKDMLTVTLGVRRAQNDATGVTPETAKAGAVQLKATPMDVAGLGDSAYWIRLGGGVQLNVFKGKREWLTFGARSKALDDPAILAALTKVAKATTAR